MPTCWLIHTKESSLSQDFKHFMCWELSFFFPLVHKGINLLVNDLDLENKLHKLQTQASYTKTFYYFHLKTVIQEEKERIIYREGFESPLIFLLPVGFPYSPLTHNYYNKCNEANVNNYLSNYY